MWKPRQYYNRRGLDKL
uniref:Uncharacterized protein n=1 Tax=Anguilla anguilla TaxID=7936 RepID=A0A0E9VKS9_ANGAN